MHCPQKGVFILICILNIPLASCKTSGTTSKIQYENDELPAHQDPELNLLRRNCTDGISAMSFSTEFGGQIEDLNSLCVNEVVEIQTNAGRRVNCTIIGLVNNHLLIGDYASMHPAYEYALEDIVYVKSLTRDLAALFRNNSENRELNISFTYYQDSYSECYRENELPEGKRKEKLSGKLTRLENGVIEVETTKGVPPFPYIIYRIRDLEIQE